VSSGGIGEGTEEDIGEDMGEIVLNWRMEVGH